MTIVIISNTNQIPGRGVFLCVQGHDDAEAVRELTRLAERRGLVLGEKCYKWAGCYYYAPVESPKADA